MKFLAKHQVTKQMKMELYWLVLKKKKKKKASSAWVIVLSFKNQQQPPHYCVRACYSSRLSGSTPDLWDQNSDFKISPCFVCTLTLEKRLSRTLVLKRGYILKLPERSWRVLSNTSPFPQSFSFNWSGCGLGSGHFLKPIPMYSKVWGPLH